MKNTIKKGDTVTIKGNGSSGVYHNLAIGNNYKVLKGRDKVGDFYILNILLGQFVNEADIKLKS